MSYYEIKTDFYKFPNQHLITEIDGFDNPKAQLSWSEFLAEYLINKQKNYTAIIESGKEEMDFTTTFYGFCIVSKKFATLLTIAKIRDILLIPLKFNKELSQEFYLLVDSLRCDCVDETSSDFQKFLENHPVRPDFAGRYRAFFKLIIDTSKTDNADFFRLKNEDSTIIVSQKIKDIYDSNQLIGASFTKVT